MGLTYGFMSLATLFYSVSNGLMVFHFNFTYFYEASLMGLKLLKIKIAAFESLRLHLGCGYELI